MFDYGKALARIERQIVTICLNQSIFTRAKEYKRHIERREKIKERGKREGYFVKEVSI